MQFPKVASQTGSMKTLLTGGTDYIGSHTAIGLLQHGAGKARTPTATAPLRRSAF